MNQFRYAFRSFYNFYRRKQQCFFEKKINEFSKKFENDN